MTLKDLLSMKTNELIIDRSLHIEETMLECKNTLNKLTDIWGDKILERTDIIIALAIIIIILGIAILWNQRKIKKMLRQLQEQKQDKPQE